MRFLYKIHARFDGFTPARIPERADGDVLRLGWSTYVDVVSRGDEVWVYFRGSRRFSDGVYARGRVVRVDYASHYVYVRLRPGDYSIADPLTDPDTSAQIAEVVAPRYRQVFIFPQALVAAPDCTLPTSASTCAQRGCEECATWPTLFRIEPSSLRWPSRLPSEMAGFAPAYWVAPPRSVIWGHESDRVKKTTEVFSRFKVGERALAFPLALGMWNALRDRRLLDFEALIPIPLSPDKAAAGELDRTGALADELSSLTDIPVRRILTLRGPISKRAMGASPAEFESRYLALLATKKPSPALGSALLVDDVCTHGSTLACAYSAMKAVAPSALIAATTAAQMTVKAAIADLDSLTDG